MHVCMCTCMYECVYVYVCVHIYMCMYIYIYDYIRMCICTQVNLLSASKILCRFTCQCLCV
jgi:hypothetical protein